MYDVFISYDGADREWVSQLVNSFSRHPLRVWDEEMGKSSDPKNEERMLQALRESVCVVFVITPASVDSRLMAAELGAALMLGKLLIPVIAEDTPQDSIFGPFKEANGLEKGEPNAVANEIARRIAAKQESAT